MDQENIVASTTATTATTDSSSSKRSREDEDDDSGPSSKILKSSDDSDPPSEEEQQAIAAAKAAIVTHGKKEETTKSSEPVPKEEAATSAPDQVEPPTTVVDTPVDTPQVNDKDVPSESTKLNPEDPVKEQEEKVNEDPQPAATEPASSVVTQEPVTEKPEEDSAANAPQQGSIDKPPSQEPVNSPSRADPQAEQQDYVEESGQIGVVYVGRVIGKGGEMIRDLQARSGAKMDVDSNVPAGHPRTITYAGTRAQVEFAKQLVEMLHQNVPEENLPLGHASQEIVIIPAAGVGKIIGRGGEMIRELQARSHAKIQVDHSGTSGLPSHEKQVTVTGTAESVTKAKEMIHFLVSNPLMEAQQSLNMLVEEKRSGVSSWGSGPPYSSMPNQGVNMQPAPPAMDPYGSAGSGGGGGGGGLPYGAPTNYANQPPQQQQQQPYGAQQPRADGGETMYAAKQFMGRIIGSKGVTINDLQQRSGTHIQINQEVAGADSEITITGPQAGIQAAKSMIREILAAGPNHPYAGGGGSAGGGGGGGGAGPYGASAGGGVSGYPAGGYHGASYGGGYHHGPGGMAAGYGGGYPPQQSQQPQQQYGGYDAASMPYGGGYGADPYGASGPMGGYGGGGNPAGGSYGGAAPYPGAGGGAPYSSGYGDPSTSYGGAFSGGGYGAAGAAAYSMPQAAPVPSGPWKMATSPDGQVYYYNDQTGQTQWEKPPGIGSD